MAPTNPVPAQLSDGELLAEVERLAACERTATAALVALLVEVDARRLHLAEGCSSLFSYCTERLHLSEHAAYHRIQAARAARAFPVILEHLASGAVTLSAVTLLRPHLTLDNHAKLLEAAGHRSTREVEVLVRRLAPLPEVRASVRRVSGGHAPETRTALPVATERPTISKPSASERLLELVCEAAAGAEAIGAPQGSAPLRAEANRSNSVHSTSAILAQAPPAEVRVLSPERYSLRVTLSADAIAKLRRAQDLMRHAVPNGDPAVVIGRALTLLVEQLERKKFGARIDRRGSAAKSDTRLHPGAEHTEGSAAVVDDPVCAGEDVSASSEARESASSAPVNATGHVPTACLYGRRPSRHIPAAVRRAVWMRDEGRCAYVGSGGRCREAGRLEFHHLLPVTDGGASTAANVELRCTAHHHRETELWFGFNDALPRASSNSARAELARPGDVTSRGGSR